MRSSTGSSFFGNRFLSAIARDVLVIDCDFLLQLPFSLVSPYVSDFTSNSCTIIQVEMVLNNKKKCKF